MTNDECEHRTFSPPQADLWQKLKKYGSTPIKLVENHSRAVRKADWSLSLLSNRHNHRGWLLLRKTRFSGVSPRCYVKDAIKHGQDGRGTLYLNLSPFQGF
jgi:hypothetical protein